ncbi:hypothetical protein SAMN04487861_105100 [Selenomonas ruminantium]|uniref:Uncharacterized protein n=1 Tax=Selenomonas ruminantium TaxID=971 RepID=A0A1I3D5B8_SELRU|nr:hypothetical protein SAMN04487861_105100 [Selenomonas ruminantium]
MKKNSYSYNKEAFICIYQKLHGVPLIQPILKF